VNQFTKSPLSINDQLMLWRNRGLTINDESRAFRYLSVISYYRLSAYCLPFQVAGSAHHFIPNVAFDDILGLYVFDREIRLLILDAIERIEVAFRARMTQVLSEHHGSHAYTDASVFNDSYDHDWLVNQVRSKCHDRNAELFIKHYCSKYGDPKLPPIWMVMEILTFKEVSVLFSQLRLKADKQEISLFFGIPDIVLRSWFRALSDLRNICAHHSRTWNREFGSRPCLLKKTPSAWPQLTLLEQTGIDPTRRIYYFLVVIECLLKRINPGSTWNQRLFDLLKKYPQVSKEHMGIPASWYKEPFWQIPNMVEL